MELITKSDQEIRECIITQDKLCKENGYPDFAPSKGVCYKCRKNIYQNYQLDNNRVSRGETGKLLVTGCPHCNMSYCD